jgi:hypothetical protein
VSELHMRETRRQDTPRYTLAHKELVVLAHLVVVQPCRDTVVVPLAQDLVKGSGVGVGVDIKGGSGGSGGTT